MFALFLLFYVIFFCNRIFPPIFYHIIFLELSRTELFQHFFKYIYSPLNDGGGSGDSGGQDGSSGGDGDGCDGGGVGGGVGTTFDLTPSTSSLDKIYLREEEFSFVCLL